MSTIPREPANFLQGLTWQNDVDLRDAPQNDRVRMTFDRGSLELDPRPDLAVEVDVASRSMNRMSIYAELGIPEVWRWTNETPKIYSLSASGRYVDGSTSHRLARIPHRSARPMRRPALRHRRDDADSPVSLRVPRSDRKWRLTP